MSKCNCISSVNYAESFNILPLKEQSSIAKEKRKGAGGHTRNLERDNTKLGGPVLKINGVNNKFKAEVVLLKTKI